MVTVNVTAKHVDNAQAMTDGELEAAIVGNMFAGQLTITPTNAAIMCEQGKRFFGTVECEDVHCPIPHGI